VGKQRFAWEHWHGSDSAAVYCYVAGEARNTTLWRLGYKGHFQLQRGQDRYLPNWLVLHDHIRLKTKKNCSERRIRDFVLLPGYMIRYAILYRMLPTYNHWIWSHYPNGDYWRTQFAAVLNNKNGTVVVVSADQVSQVVGGTVNE
jgi:hypothetical protein